MSEQRLTNDRKFKRYSAKDGSLAIIKGDLIVTASIIDINMEGLALQYERDYEIYPAETSKLDIYVAADDFFLTDLPFENVSELKTTCSKPYCPNSVKRCSIKFGKLMPDQETQLKYFIKHHTIRDEQRV